VMVCPIARAAMLSRTYGTILRGGSMRITASKLRENIYQILDEAITTGTPVEVIRKGTVLRIVPEKRVSKLSRLKKRTGFQGNPDDVIGIDWMKEWTELK
jgi:hypothetical protein